MKNDEWQSLLFVGFILGFFVMGVLMYVTATREVKQKKAACELNIPRNQECVMQFVPETKQSRG